MRGVRKGRRVRAVDDSGAADCAGEIIQRDCEETTTTHPLRNSAGERRTVRPDLPTFSSNVELSCPVLLFPRLLPLRAARRNRVAAPPLLLLLSDESDASCRWISNRNVCRLLPLG